MTMNSTWGSLCFKFACEIKCEAENFRIKRTECVLSATSSDGMYSDGYRCKVFSVRQHGRCRRISKQLQALCVVKVLCSGAQ